MDISGLTTLSNGLHELALRQYKGFTDLGIDWYQSGIDTVNSGLDTLVRSAFKPQLFLRAKIEMLTGEVEPAVPGTTYHVPGMEISRVIDYSVPGDPDPIPTLFLPPPAGHGPLVYNAIFDPRKVQSQVRVARDRGLRNLYGVDHVSAKQEHDRLGMDDMVEDIGRAMDFIQDKDYGGRKVQFNVVAQCAHGYPALMYTIRQIQKDDPRVKSLVVAGSPNDPQAGESGIKKSMEFNSTFMPWIYEAMSTPRVSGETMVFSFKMMNPAERYIGDDFGLWNALDDPSTDPGVMPPDAQAMINFGRWYNKGYDIPKRRFQEIIPFFRDSPLVNGCHYVGDDLMYLSSLAPPLELILIGGKDDDVTDPRDVFAITPHTSYPGGGTGWKMDGKGFAVTPPDEFASLINEKTLGQQVVEAVFPGGHVAIFMSSKNMKYYVPLFDHWRKRNDSLREGRQINLTSYH